MSELFVVAAYHTRLDFWISEVETFFSLDEANMVIHEIKPFYPEYVFSINKKAIAGTHENFRENYLRKVDEKLRAVL